MTQSMDGWFKQTADKAINAGAKIGNATMSALREGGAKIASAMPGSAADAGRMAGQGMNAAEAGVEATKTAASDAAAGFKEARGLGGTAQPAAGGGGTPGNFNGRPAPADGFKVGPSGAIEADAAKAAPKGGLLRGAARLGGWTAAGMAAIGAGEEAVDQMNTAGIAGALGKQEGVDAQRDAKADTNPFARNSNVMSLSDPLVQNRIARLKGMGQAALDAINPFSSGKEGLRAPASPGATMANVNGNMIPTNQGPQTPDQLLDGNAVPASGNGAFRNNQTRVAQKVGGNGSYDGMLPNLSPNATPEEAARYLQKSQDLGAIAAAGREGLRKDLASINGGGAGGVPQALQDMSRDGGPAGAIASLSAYGAMSRMNKNQADVGLRRDANAIAAQKSNFEMASKNRDAKMKQDEVNRGTMEKELEGYARTKAGDKQISELPGTYETRVKGELAKVRQDLDYSMGNRKDGRKLEDLSGAERQQFFLYKNIKDKVTDSRGQISQKFRDYFGNKQFDSKDAYSYAPTGVEDTIQNGLPALKVRLANGNTMTVSSAAGGGFNLTGPNDPVDADVMALVAPFVKKHEDSKKKPQGFRNEMPVIGNRG